MRPINNAVDELFQPRELGSFAAIPKGALTHHP